MNFIKYIKLILSIVIFTSGAYAAQVTLNVNYGQTGGLAGDLNQVGDRVNGRNICPSFNTYANATPGCDMSSDPGINDNGTQNDYIDDYYEGDLIVRTNDSFEVVADYSWNGIAGGAEEKVTLTGVLPAVKGFVWDVIPGSCSLPESSISADKKTLVCVRKNGDVNNVGSYAEKIYFLVKVEADAQNGSTPGDIKFTIDTPNNIDTPDTQSTHTENTTDNDQIKITASPRWNIDKSGTAGYYYTQYNQTNPNTGENGYLIWYQFTVELDEVAEETESTSNPSLGNEALSGKDDATVTFTDDISGISPNAVYADWADEACSMLYANSDEPYAAPDATYPDRSISAPNGPLVATCVAAGQDIGVTVDHIDGTLANAPTKDRAGRLLPVNRKIAAIGTIKIFVPLSDVEKGEDGIADTEDDGTLLTTNSLKDFAPKGFSGTENFNGDGESAADNSRDILLYAAKGSGSKSYRAGWSDVDNQREQWGGAYWANPPTDASTYYAGDGTATPGTLWGTYVSYSNQGGSDILTPMICDVIDINTFEMAILDTVDDPATAVDDTKHAVDINYDLTETLPNIRVQYAIGYVGIWPPDADTAAVAGVAEECNATTITWYDDFVQAKAAADAAGTAVSKARMFADKIAPNQVMAMRIKHKARATYFGTNTPIANKTLLVNYATYKSSLTNGKYMNNYYIPHDADTSPEPSTSGDRLIMQQAKVRIIKDMQPASTTLGTDVTVTLTPSFTVDGTNQVIGDLTVVDVLPKGLVYKNGTTTGSYGAAATAYGEPTVYAPATDAQCNQYAAAVVAAGKPCGTLNGGTGAESILVWDLAAQTTGTVHEDISFTATVSIDAPNATLSNYAQIESPADDSEAIKRIANANVTNSVPSSLLIIKSVETPVHEINNGSLLNWMKFKVGVRNGFSTTLLALDIIDILPFNGDGTLGSFTFTPSIGTTIDRNRAPATNFSGTFEFDSMSFDDNQECDANDASYWFTKNAGPLDTSPLASSNTLGDGSPSTIWCEGTVSGPAASCGFTKSEVTAVRLRGVDVQPSGTCYLNLAFATANNTNDNVYSNTAGAKATSVGSAVLSNTVSTKVYASSIGDKVWLDVNHNGVQDAGEVGLKDVTVKLIDVATGNVVETTQTDTNGIYGFSNLIHGDYMVEVVPPAGYIATSKYQGGDDALDSDINANMKTDTITLGEDQDIVNVDAGLSEVVISISGNVLDDGDGDANVNGTAISTPDGVQLHATLLDANGAVLATTAVAADGTYSFGGLDGIIPNTNYSVVLATTSSATASDLPENWNNTGENINSASAGNDGGTPGVIAVALEESGITDIDFGINKKPTAEDASEPARHNPSGDTKYLVPKMPISDHEDGTPTTVTIKILPYPASGTLYYDGQSVTAGQVIPNFDPNKLMVDPEDGNQNVAFTYTATDNAGVESDPATVTMPFLGEIYVGDKVWMDNNGNGAQDLGEPGVAGVVVALHDENGTQIATTTTDENGHYQFKIEIPGRYHIEFDNDHYYTRDCPPCSDDNDSDVSGQHSATAPFDLDWGDNDMTHDAGVTPTAHIGDHFWVDANKNGIQDPDEEPVMDALVELLDENGSKLYWTDETNTSTTTQETDYPIETNTTTEGEYGFDVPAGTYQVRFHIPDSLRDKGYVFDQQQYNNNDAVNVNTANDEGITQTVTVGGSSGKSADLTLDGSVNCGCADASIQSNGGDALGTLGLLLMILMILGSGLLFVRREAQTYAEGN